MSERGSGSILLTGGGFALEPNPGYLSLSIGARVFPDVSFWHEADQLDRRFDVR